MSPAGLLCLMMVGGCVEPPAETPAVEPASPESSEVPTREQASPEAFRFRTSTPRKMRGAVIGADGQPAVGAVAAIYSIEPDRQPRQLARAAADRDGNIHLRVILPSSRDAFAVKVLDPAHGMVTLPEEQVAAWIASPNTPITIQLSGGDR